MKVSSANDITKDQVITFLTMIEDGILVGKTIMISDPMYWRLKNLGVPTVTSGVAVLVCNGTLLVNEGT